jgi:hypothetical protein
MLNESSSSSYEDGSKRKRKVRRGLACAACSASKRSCDGNRPCDRCLANHSECQDRQMNASGKKAKIMKACSNCIKSKAKCGMERPCARCVKKGIVCLGSGDESAGVDWIESMIDGEIQRVVESDAASSYDSFFSSDLLDQFGVTEDRVMTVSKGLEDSPTRIYFLQYERNPENEYGMILKTVLENTSPMDLVDFALHSGKWSIFWKNIAKSITPEEAIAFKEQTLQSCLAVASNPDELLKQNYFIQAFENITFEFGVSF